MNLQHTDLPVLYSFRRCPYAMRARMAIRYSTISVELREVFLKHKPEAMLQASPKATVPVLVVDEDTVIDESLDIMIWALQHNDPHHWCRPELQHATASLIHTNDTIFKTHLDHYKYFDRFPQHPQLAYRQQAEAFLQQLEQRLSTSHFLFCNQPTLADVAIFPFIRQFAYVDIDWFNDSPYACLRCWLKFWLDSDLFLSIMHKHTPWKEGAPAVVL